MAFFVRRDRKACRTHGFKSITLTPGGLAVNPHAADLTLASRAGKG